MENAQIMGSVEGFERLLNQYPGYHMLGRLFAGGYMRGLMDAAKQRP